MRLPGFEPGSRAISNIFLPILFNLINAEFRWEAHILTARLQPHKKLFFEKKGLFMIEIDGCYLEGGGQILRTAVALSAITKTPVHIYNIRGGRKQPGLKAQHLAAISAVADLYNADLRGAKIGSKEIYFTPKELSSNSLKIKIKTAGSVGLVLQTLFLASCKKLKIEIEGGGTSGKWAPSVIYLQHVFLKTLKRFGFRADIKIIRHGFYPKGGAKVLAEIFQTKLKGFSLDRKIEKIEGISIASEDLKRSDVAVRQKNMAENILRKLNLPVEIKEKYVTSISSGSIIELWTAPTILGANSLGEFRKRAELVGEESARKLINEITSGATVDKYLADQLIPFMALAEGNSSYRVSELTNHTKTNIWITEKFIDRKFRIKKSDKLFEIHI